MFEGKRILITGATGLIGSHLLKRLLDEGAHVIAIGRSKQKLDYVFEEEMSCSNCELVDMDINTGIPENLFGNIDYIFHAASPIAGSEIREKPVDTIKANLTGTITCLEYLKRQITLSGIKGRLVIFSSATVYGNQISQNSGVSEEHTECTDALGSANAPYSESKRMIEVLADAYYHQYEVDSVIARMGYVYGFSKCAPNTAFYEFIHNVINHEDIILNNSGMPKRDNIYVEDVVDGLIKIALEGRTMEAYNISSNGEKNNFCAIDEIASVIAQISNVLFSDSHIKAKILPYDGARKSGLRLDNSKIKNLGWKVQTDLYDGLKMTIQSYMK